MKNFFTDTPWDPETDDVMLAVEELERYVPPPDSGWWTRFRYGVKRHPWLFWGGLVPLVVASLLLVELHTSWTQVFVLSRWTAAMTYRVDEGPSDQIRFPNHGPYNERLGYARLPAMIDSLETQGYAVAAQARISDALSAEMALGLFPVYPQARSVSPPRIASGATSFGSVTPGRAGSNAWRQIDTILKRVD